MAVGGKYTTQNRLWLLRKRQGLGQKQVAYLLHHHTADQVSRYEKGLRIPNLETALKLSIIYDAPVRLLFTDLYEELQRDIRERIKAAPKLKETYPNLPGEDAEARKFCAYEELLDVPHPSDGERDQVRHHITRLVKRHAYL